MGMMLDSNLIGMNDSWIAAQCIAEGLTLLTRNIGEFVRVPGLSVEKW
jgi:predicted nucleic acid-binding protein